VGIRERRRRGSAVRATEPPDLARRLLAGDEALFGELVAQLHPGLRRLARAIVGNDATADEVAQETWKAVLRALPGFGGRSSVRTWVHRVCVNLALTRAGSDHRAPVFEAPAIEADDAFDDTGCWREPPPPWSDETPETLLLRREVVDSIRRAVDALPVGQRAVIVLRDFEGFTAEEACEILGLTEANQRVLLHRARRRVRSGCQHLVRGAKARRPETPHARLARSAA